MPIPVLQPRTFFGLRTDVSGNAQYVSDHEIMYPVGAVITIHNYTQKRQRYIKLAEKEANNVNIICIGPNKKLVAVAEFGEKPCISLFDVSTLKRKKVLTPPAELSVTEFVTIAYTYDAKYLIAITGEPDSMMLCYNCDKGKIESFTKAVVPASVGTVVQVACNPADNNTVCIVGNGLFRLLTVSDTSWRQFGYQKADILPISCVCWLTSERVLAGTRDGRLLLVDGGELKGIYNALEALSISLKDKDKDDPVVPPASQVEGEDYNPDFEVYRLISFNKGFAYTCGTGLVHLFEKDSNTKYQKVYEYKIPVRDYQDPSGILLDAIQCLSVNVMQDKLLASTARGQLYTVRLWGKDTSHKEVTAAPVVVNASDIVASTETDPEAPAAFPTVIEARFKFLGQQLHYGPVIGLALCTWKPIFLTCSKCDYTVRVWNFETETQELIKQYQEPIHSVALHPTGLYFIAGFSEKLRFLIILIDDVQSCREFPISNCQACMFSNNGHMFAALDGNVVQVFSSITFQNLYSLQGHSEMVTSILWSQSDNKLLTCGSEGVLYMWDTFDGKKIGEVVEHTTAFTGVAISSDERISYVISGSGELREIYDNTVMKVAEMVNIALSHIVLSRSDLMLFVAAVTGTILSVKVPMTDPAEFNECQMHNHPLTKICLTYDDQNLISCCEDGSLCIWKLTFNEGKSIKMDKEFVYSSEILISKSDLEKKIASIEDLTGRMHRLQTNYTKEMQQTEIDNANKIKDVHEEYSTALEEQRQKIDQLESEHFQEVNNINADITNMKDTHERAMKAMEENYNVKLIVEYDKYQLLEQEAHRMRDSYDRKLEELEAFKTSELEAMSERYELALDEKNAHLVELREEGQHQILEHEEIKQQIEEDADREIIDVKTKYEGLVRDEHETAAGLRAEIGIMKKKFTTSQKEIDDLKQQVSLLQQEHSKFQNAILERDRDIMDLKKEINERSATIQDKEKRISDLKHKNMELEKFKFVLNYKIDELKNQIEPKDKEIWEKKEQIEDMEQEMGNLTRTKTSLRLQVAELHVKLNATENELEAEQQRYHHSSKLLRRLRVDLHNVARLTGQPNQLKSAVQQMYTRYNQNKDLTTCHEQDVDAHEFMRQREHLERTVASLKRQVKDPGKKQADTSRITEENVNLTAEINYLRRQLKLSQRYIADLDTILGPSKQRLPPKEAKARLDAATKRQDEIHLEYKQQIAELNNVTSALKEEINHLMNKLLLEKQQKEQQQSQEQQQQINQASSERLT